MVPKPWISSTRHASCVRQVRAADAEELSIPIGDWRRRRRTTGRSSWHASWLGSLPTTCAAPTLVYGIGIRLPVGAAALRLSL